MTGFKMTVRIFPWKGVSARASRKKFFFSKLAALIFPWKGVSARAFGADDLAGSHWKSMTGSMTGFENQ